MNEKRPLSCDDCRFVCSLREKANRIEAQLPVATIEAELRQAALAAASQTVEGLEMANLESNIVYEELGVRVGEPDLKEYAAALDEEYAGFTAERDDPTYMLRAGGARWAEIARKMAADCIEHCDGPKRGVRIPFTLGVVPLPFGLGKTHCTSELQDYAKGHIENTGIGGDIGIDAGLESLEPSSPPPDRS